MRGTDAAGQTFKENTWTIKRQQARRQDRTFRQLAVDDEIVIENHCWAGAPRPRVNRGL